jgi:PhoH-like ATPase
MEASFGGVQTLVVPEKCIDDIYSSHRLSIFSMRDKVLSTNLEDQDWTQIPNLSLVLKAEGTKKSALARVDSLCQNILLAHDYSKLNVCGLKPRNKEQNLLFNLLMDEAIRCVAIEGKAGCGKSLCAMAAAFELLENGDEDFKKIILTRPMSTVGKDIGALPGSDKEKFIPYLANYFSNFEVLFSSNFMFHIEAMIDKGTLEFVPLALIGGASWQNAIIIADEVQSLKHEEFYALTTRAAETSKLFILGDLKQRYGRILDEEQTGLHRWVNSKFTKMSPVCASLKLLKQERSRLAEVAYNVFSDEEKQGE